MERFGWVTLLVVCSAASACSSGGSGTTTTGGTTGGGQCVVPSQVTSDLTLGLECATWSVTSTVKVGSSSSPTLTLPAGVKVAFSPGTFIDIGDGQPGGIQVQGNSGSHVTFTSAAATPAPGDWGGLQISSSARSDTSLSFLDVSYAGAPSTLSKQAALVVDGTAGTGGGDVTPKLVNVTLSSSKGHGFFFQGNHTGPGIGSGTLAVNGWDSAVTGHFYPFVIDPDAAGMLPTSVTATSAMATAVISLQNSHAMDVVDVSQTWGAMPLPFLLGADGTSGGLTIGSATSSAVLTVAAPNTLQFAHGYGVTIANDPSNANMSGALVANGSSGSPITFTSASATPAAGDWGGFQFEFATSGASDSSLSNCNIQYAGGSFHVNSDYGAIVLLGDAPVHVCDLVGPTIDSCTFTGVPSGNNGIVAVQVGMTQTQGYGTQNTFPSGTNPVLVEPCS